MSYKYVVKQKLHGADVVNVLTFEDDNSPNDLDRDTIAANIVSAYETHLAPVFSSKWSLVGIDMYNTANVPGTPGVPHSDPRYPLAGGSGTQAAANQLSVLVKSVTTGGPPFRGRVYLSGWTETLMGDNGEINGSQRVSAVAWADDLNSILVPSGKVLGRVIISRGTDTVAAGTEALVETNTAAFYPASQRRRRIGTGS